MEKLIFPRKKSFDQNTDKVMRALITESMLVELDKLSDETGLSMQQISGKCIEFALQHVELIDI